MCVQTEPHCSQEISRPVFLVSGGAVVRSMRTSVSEESERVSWGSTAGGWTGLAESWAGFAVARLISRSERRTGASLMRAVFSGEVGPSPV